MESPRANSQWQAPIELQRSTPREVTLTAAGRMLMVFAILMVLGAIGSFVYLYGQASADAERWAAWQAEAAPAQGRVLEARKSGSGDSARMVVRYEYDANGTTLEGRARLRYNRWRSLRPGMTLPMAYRRSEPSVHWISGAEPRGVPMFVPFLVAAALLAGPPLMAYSIRRQRRLLEEGRPALARVTNTKRIHVQHGGSVHRINYEFQTLSGGTATGKADAHKNPPAEGSEIVIVYHPDEPNWSARYPLSLVKTID